MTRDQMIDHILAANAVAKAAADHGHHPFGAILVGPDNTILMRQGNIDTVHHAETEVARRAAAEFAPEFLWNCTLVSTGLAGRWRGRRRFAGPWTQHDDGWR